jgi:hypothetical protein
MMERCHIHIPKTMGEEEGECIVLVMRVVEQVLDTCLEGLADPYHVADTIATPFREVSPTAIQVYHLRDFSWEVVEVVVQGTLIAVAFLVEVEMVVV